MTFNEICEIDQDKKEEIEERAGIIEFDGNKLREFAEKESARLLSKKYDLYLQIDLLGMMEQKLNDKQWRE